MGQKRNHGTTSKTKTPTILVGALVAEQSVSTVRTEWGLLTAPPKLTAFSAKPFIACKSGANGCGLGQIQGLFVARLRRRVIKRYHGFLWS